MKDDRNDNGGRESRRPWVQRNAVWLVLVGGWLFGLSGVGIKTWAQSESTTVLANKTEAQVSVNSGIIAQTKIELTEIKGSLTAAKEDITEIKDEQKEQRTLLNQILRAVNT